MNRVFPPLKADHPLVKDAGYDCVCPLCRKPFLTGQRIMLIPARIPSLGVETVPAAVAHANCCLAGMKTEKGIIARIKDGDGSPYPVLTEDGKQWKFQEVGIDE